MMNVNVLQERIGYSFRQIDLLQTALTHRSFSSHHNERLEFLGDSLLNCVTAINLYERYVELNEGNLSRLRSSLVRQQALYEIAQKLDMSSFLRLGEGELKAGGFKRPSILADAMEALFGAIFLDSDFETVRRVITQLFTDMMKGLDPETFGKDAKTQLQEYLQGHKLALPEYQVVATHGAAHNQEFEMYDRQIRHSRVRNGFQPTGRRTGSGTESAGCCGRSHEKQKAGFIRKKRP